MDFEIAFSPRARKSPYFDRTVAAGVKAFSIYNHTYFPVSYGSMETEYWRLFDAVAIWDVSCQRQIEVAGPDADLLTQAVCTRDMRDTAIGQGRYTAMCDHEGRLLNDPLVLKVDDDRWWISIADSDMLFWIRAIKAERGLNASVTELDVAPLAVQGRYAEDTLADMIGDWIRDIRFFRFVEIEHEGIPFWIGRAGYSGVDGFELYLTDPSKGGELWDHVMAAGEPYDIGPGTPNHMERVESGFISIRTETLDDSDPYECRLGRYVSADPDLGYIGAEALAAKREAGLSRELVGLVVDGPRRLPNTTPLTVKVGEDVVGQVRTLVWSPQCDSMIALGLIDVPHNELGTKMTVDVDGGVVGAMVTEVPFV